MITAEIKDVQIDGNGNIVVMTDYKDADGQVIQTGLTRYSFSAALTMDDIIAKAKKEIDEHCKVLVVRTYAKTKNSDSIENLKTGLKGYTTTASAAKVKIDGNEVDVSVDGVVAVNGEPVVDTVQK